MTGGFPEDAVGSLRDDRLAGSRVGADGEPPSPVCGDAGGESGGRNGLVAEHLHEAFQPEARGVGAFGLPDTVAGSRAESCGTDCRGTGSVARVRQAEGGHREGNTGGNSGEPRLDSGESPDEEPRKRGPVAFTGEEENARLTAGIHYCNYLQPDPWFVGPRAVRGAFFGSTTPLPQRLGKPRNLRVGNNLSETSQEKP